MVITETNIHTTTAYTTGNRGSSQFNSFNSIRTKTIKRKVTTSPEGKISAKCTMTTDQTVGCGNESVWSLILDSDGNM
jgi:hypothetical protein